MTTARSQTLRIVGNVVAFQIGWFACVLAAARRLDLAGIGAVLIIVVVHLAFATRRGNELRLIGSTVAVGAVWDSLLRGTGLMLYVTAGPTWLAPAWILAMWALFGTTLNLSLHWLRGRTLIAMLFGAAGGPMAFWAGQRLGAVQIAGPWTGLLAQAAGWSVILPGLLHLAQWFDRRDGNAHTDPAHV